jgi:glutathione synthase
MRNTWIEDRLEMLFIIDPLASLNAAHDSSVALMESAQARGHRVHIATIADMGVRDGRATALCMPVVLSPATLKDGRWIVERDWFGCGSVNRRVLDDMDAVFMRVDPPVNSSYLRATYILDFVDENRVVLVNSPRGLRAANEKLFALRFPALCPPTLISANVDEITEMVHSWDTAVLKPTDGMAGRGIMLLHAGDQNVRSIIESATGRGHDAVVIQKFLSRSCEGDRRVIVLDGNPIGAVRRLAPADDFRCNMAVGATVTADSVTDRDKDICQELAPDLATFGVALAGLDIIGDQLIEINVTSPTGLREIDAFDGARQADQIVSWVECRNRA